MANDDHLAKLRGGIETWNAWRQENPLVRPDLRLAELGGARLSRADLRAADLSFSNLREADLSGARLDGVTLSNAILIGADFKWVNLGFANLIAANLCEADLSWAYMNAADLRHANLRDADLSEARLNSSVMGGANLSGATMYHADLREADLHKTNLRGTLLREAMLNEASLNEADLSGANLQSANLQYAYLHRAILTDAWLWETQRAGWSIKEIICERAYWDQRGEHADHYAPGQFERLYSDTTRIELFYPEGVTTFEINTLPALLHNLASKYPDSGIRLKSMAETGGGTKISISIEDTNPESVDKIRAEATRSQSALLALRDNDAEIARLQGMLAQANRTFDQLFSRILDTPRVQANNLIMAGDYSVITAHQTHNDTEAILALLAQIQAHSGELPKAQESQLEREVQSIQHELSQPEPKPSVISSGLKVVKEIATKVIESTAEKAITENWHTWLTQLTALMHHWPS